MSVYALDEIIRNIKTSQHHPKRKRNADAINGRVGMIIRNYSRTGRARTRKTCNDDGEDSKSWNSRSEAEYRKEGLPEVKRKRWKRKREREREREGKDL